MVSAPMVSTYLTFFAFCPSFSTATICNDVICDLLVYFVKFLILFLFFLKETKKVNKVNKEAKFGKRMYKEVIEQQTKKFNNINEKVTNNTNKKSKIFSMSQPWNTDYRFEDGLYNESEISAKLKTWIFPKTQYKKINIKNV